MKILLFGQGLDEFTPKAPELDEKNSLALAIAPSGKIFVCSGSYFFSFSESFIYKNVCMFLHLHILIFLLLLKNVHLLNLLIYHYTNIRTQC